MSVGRHAAPAPARAARVRSGAVAARLLLTLAIAAGAAAGISSLAAGNGANHGPAPGAIPEIGAVPPADAASFAILRRPLRGGDSFAPQHAGAGPLGANPALTRTLREPRGGLSAGSVSVVPANGAVCLRVPFAARGAQWFCQPLALARAGRLVMALRPAGALRASRQLLVGLVPDGVEMVTVTAASGVPRPVAVHDNVYDVQLFAPRTVSMRLPAGGTRSYPAP